MKYNKGDLFLDKYTYKMYIFDGNEWLEIVPASKIVRTCKLKKLTCKLKKLIGLNYDK
jgi:hypothetical protein